MRKIYGLWKLNFTIIFVSYKYGDSQINAFAICAIYECKLRVQFVNDEMNSSIIVWVVLQVFFHFLFVLRVEIVSGTLLACNMFVSLPLNICKHVDNNYGCCVNFECIGGNANIAYITIRYEYMRIESCVYEMFSVDLCADGNEYLF